MKWASQNPKRHGAELRWVNMAHNALNVFSQHRLTSAILPLLLPCFSAQRHIRPFRSHMTEASCKRAFCVFPRTFQLLLYLQHVANIKDGAVLSGVHVWGDVAVFVLNWHAPACKLHHLPAMLLVEIKERSLPDGSLEEEKHQVKTLSEGSEFR